MQAAANAHTWYYLPICAVLPAASAQPADNYILHQKRQATFWVHMHVCTHQARSTANLRPENPLPENARHSFLIPMHTRHSLGRRTPPRRPDLPSPSPTTDSAINHRFQSASSSCCGKDHITTMCFLFHAQKPLFWPHQALQGMTSHAVRTPAARLHGSWRNKCLPLPLRMCTSMPPAATTFAVIALRCLQCAAEHYCTARL